MDLKESASASCEGLPVVKTDVDSPLYKTDESCSTYIKDEPLDITELSLKDFKKGLDDFDVNIKEELYLEDTNNDFDTLKTNTSNIIGKNTSGIIEKSLNNITSNKVPVTRKVIMNGKDKTCILVKNPALKEIIRESIQKVLKTANIAPSPNKQLLKNDDEKNLFSTKLSSETKRGRPRRRRYNCNLCSYVTRNLIDLKVHTNGHVKEKPILQCGKCTFRSTIRALEAHKKIHASSSSKDVMTFRHVERSIEGSLLLEDNTFSCSICSFTTDKQEILEDHERHHQRINLPIVRCFYCNERFTKYMLYLHIQNIHPGQRFQIGYQQPYRVQTEAPLVRSINSLSKTEEDNVEPPYFEAPQNCSVCSFSTNDQVILGAHLRDHQFEPIERTTVSGRIKYDCRVCSYGHHNIATIIRHINSHKKNLPIMKCPECDFRSTECALMYHMRKCTSKSTDNFEEGIGTSRNTLEFSESLEKSFKCMICSFSTHNKIKLQLHVKEKHLIKRKDSLGRLLYQCELCSFSNRIFTSIVSHLNCHKSNVPIVKCPNCDFKSIPKSLISHWRRCKSKKKVQIEENHLFEPIRDTDSSGRQRIRCKMCSYGSNQLKIVLRHIESHKRNIPIVNCSFCDFRSTLTAVAHHQRKCKSANVENNKDILGKTECSEISIQSGKTNSDLQTNLNTSDNEIVTDQNAVSKRNKLKLLMKKKHLCEFVKRKDPLGRLSYHCKLCSYSSSKRIFMIRHMNWHKSNVPILKCRNCDFKSIRRVLACHVRKCRLNAKVHKEKHLFEPVKDADSSGRPRFYCKMCSYSSNRLQAVLRHIESHKRNLPIVSCSYCDFKSTLIPMRHHLKKCKFANVEPNENVLEKAAAQKENSIKSEKINSDVCASTETNLNTLDPEHTKTVSNETITDQNSVPSSESNEGPSRQVHTEKDLFTPTIFLNISGTTYQCKMCSYSSGRLENVTVHINTHKNEMPIINCFNNCGFKSTRNAVAQHFKRCGSRSDTIDIGNTNKAGSVFTCPICTYSTSLRIKLKLHMKKRHFKKMFSCAQCSFFTQYKSRHVRHVKSHARLLPLKKCPYCSFKSVSDIIKKHVQRCVHKRKAPQIQKSPVKIQKYNCELCSFNTFLDHSYNYHMRTHAFGQPIKKCPQCDFMSTYKALARHRFVKRHFMKKTTKMVKSITRKKHKNKDKRTVKSQAKYFKCKLCSLVCNRQYTLRKHMESHRLNYPIKKCPYCNFKTTQQALYRHIWKNHDAHGIVKKEQFAE